jgi:hypothetical protein
MLSWPFGHQRTTLNTYFQGQINISLKCLLPWQDAIKQVSQGKPWAMLLWPFGPDMRRQASAIENNE